MNRATSWPWSVRQFTTAFSSSTLRSKARVLFRRLCMGLTLTAILLAVASPASALLSGNVAQWPGSQDPNNPNRTIFKVIVCAVDAESVKQLPLLKTTLEGSWQKNSNIVFLGFVACSSLTAAEQAEAVGWHLSKNGPQNSQLGYANCKGRVTEAVFCVQSGTPPSYVPACQKAENFDTCFSQYAIHEFGHVLGFSHEFERWDRPCGCNSGSGSAYGPPYVYFPPMGDYGSYDLKSIMAYSEDCIPENSGSVRFGGPNLSADDIGGLRAIYGTPPASVKVVESSSPVPKKKDAGLKFDATKCPLATQLTDDEIIPSECGVVKRETTRPYCRDRLCIEDSGDPNHPKFMAKYPIEPAIKTNEIGSDVRRPEVQLPEYTFKVPCDGAEHRTQNYAISPAGAIKVTLETDGTCSIKETWWFRDHWTVTCWVEMSGANYTRYRCQNWNTTWGDTHYAFFKGQSKKTAAVPKAGAAKPADVVQSSTYCRDGNCIPEVNSPFHPKHVNRYPVSVPPPTKTNLGDSLPDFTGKFDTKTTTQRYSISPSGSIEVSLYCPSSCRVQETWWNRDHWTVTCWVQWSTSTHTTWRCQNWNTVWGDPHPAWFDIQCAACATK